MQWKQRTDTDNNLWLKVMGCNWLFVTWSCIPTLSLARSLPAVDHNQDRHLIEDATLTATKGAITSKIKHVIKLKTSAARLAQCAVIGCKLKQNANEGCNSCASLAARFKFYCMFLFYLWSLLNGPITKLFLTILPARSFSIKTALSTLISLSVSCISTISCGGSLSVHSPHPFLSFSFHSFPASILSSVSHRTSHNPVSEHGEHCKLPRLVRIDPGGHMHCGSFRGKKEHISPYNTRTLA